MHHLLGVPSGTPPRRRSSPAPGPKSTIQSASSIVSSSCSTTSTELPRSRSFFSVLDQAPVVALVQANRRLVENIDDARQLAAHLRGQANALRSHRPTASTPLRSSVR
jgi:hypothetical protein